MKKPCDSTELKVVPTALFAVLAGTLASVSFGAEDGKSAMIEEVFVTARKVEENIQDVPISITALSADDLDARGVVNLTDVQNFVPNFGYTASTAGGSVFQAFIRGVGQAEWQTVAEQSVGVYVDGVFVGRSFGGAMDLVDLERVEVLRGPQGTLFGRNAVAGVLSIVTARPTEAIEGMFEVTGGERNRLDGKAMISGPIIEDKLLGRFSAASLNQDGYGRNDFRGSDTGNVNSDVLRGQLLWKMTDDVEFLLAGDWQQKRANGGLERMVALTGGNFINLYNQHLTSQGLPPFDARFVSQNASANQAGAAIQDAYDIYGVSLTAQVQLSQALLKSITAYREVQAQSGFDFDASPYPVADAVLDFDQDQISQEFQLIGSSFNDKLNWVLGLYYFQEHGIEHGDQSFFSTVSATGGGNFDIVRNGGFFAPFFGDFVYDIDVETKSYAAYAQADYQLTDRLSATLGLRYTYETKDMTNAITPPSALFFQKPEISVDDDWSNLTPRFGLQYEFTDDVMAFASAAKGFRSGGFNGRDFGPGAPGSYDPETIWSYELGVRSSLLDRRLLLNLTGFFYDYQDRQSGQLTPGGLTIGNIAALEIYGFEFELTARPTPNLDFGMTLGNINDEVVEIDPTGILANSISFDEDLIQSPDWTVATYGQYVVELGGLGSITLRADYSYRTDLVLSGDDNPLAGQEGYGLLNGRIKYATSDEHWEFEVYAKNLSDEFYDVYGFDFSAFGTPAVVKVQGPPREVGATFRFRF